MQKELHRRQVRQLLSQAEDGDETEQQAVHEAEDKPEGEVAVVGVQEVKMYKYHHPSTEQIVHMKTGWLERQNLWYTIYCNVMSHQISCHIYRIYITLFMLR